jgi:PadR family transcriptional regulator PadR
MPEPDISQLLSQWEETYKKGLLTFWMLLCLEQRPSYAYEMKEAIAELSQNTIEVDEKSIYRALKRFAETGLVISDFQPSEVGPPRRYFSLTHAGRTLLLNFIDRNILIFQAPAVVKALDRLGRETKRKE